MPLPQETECDLCRKWAEVYMWDATIGGPLCEPCTSHIFEAHDLLMSTAGISHPTFIFPSEP